MNHFDGIQSGSIKFNSYNFLLMQLSFYFLYLILYLPFIEEIQISKHSTIMELLNLIYKEQIQNRIKHDYLFIKIEQVEKAINQIAVINNISTAVPNFDNTFMANWPIKNEQQFQNISKLLLEDSFVLVVHRFFL